ncbi:hypothetical protein NMG60_11006273 [Bertholletia excelsa]
MATPTARFCIARHLFFSRKPAINIFPLSALPIATIATIGQGRWRNTFSHIFQECADRRALGPGKQAHARMIVSGFEPTIFVTNCLMQMYVRSSTLDCARILFDQMPQRDTISCNILIFGYSGSGNMSAAQLIFDSMLEKDVITWNSLISGYLQNGNHGTSIGIFLQMRRAEIMYDHTTFAILFKACSALENIDMGIQLHGLAVHMGFNFDVVTGSAIVDMYAKCKKLGESLQFFLEMPEKNWVSWSAVIAGCVQNDELVSGLELFKEMQKEGVGVSQSTYASVFRSCAGLSALRLGSQLHAHALKADFGSDSIVATATLDMYAKCHSLLNARNLFNSLPKHNLQSFNAIIVGYTRNDQGSEAFKIFQLLMKSDLGFDEVSLSGALSACAVLKGLLEGMQVHGLTIKSTFRSEMCVGNAILDMYGKCGALIDARRVFDEMEIRDAVSWNAIIAAYEQNGNEMETLSLFVLMVRSRMKPDEFTYGSILKACAGQQALNPGMEVHNRIIKHGMCSDSFIGSAIVDMYCKCGKVEEAEKLHNRMEEQTIVSWNAMISGFSSNELREEAQRCFSQMLEMRINPDDFTYATILDTCADVAAVGLGKQIHAQIIKQELQSDVYITSTLVDMYSKCGDMEGSRVVFEKAANRDFVTWNAMICGYAHHGHGKEALAIFEEMQLMGVEPNHATFVSVLRACAHMGLVKQGFYYFNAMSSEYMLDPKLEHYSCMVDLLGRSGQVSEALSFVRKMPIQADDVIWRTLLSSCKMQGNVEVAEEATKSLLQLDPEDSAAYILLSNVYANAGMWGEVSKMRKMMRYGGLKKEPGCSWIEVKSELHLFLAGDKTHPRRKEIYENLNALIAEMKWAGYVPSKDYVLEYGDTEYELQEELVSCM